MRVIAQDQKSRLLKAAGWALLTALFIGLPTDIIPNPIFGREVPVRAWEYPVLIATVALTFAWFAVQAPRRPRDDTRLAGGLTLALFAVACPACNKILLLLLGASGALSWWAPLQPYVAILALGALALALYLRIRNRACTDETCSVRANDDEHTSSRACTTIRD
ncbi:MAG: hypothetical protein Q4P36_03470 [Bowdeniella nasicola]|nr:hypothetical protein [Bowdeniella nasicola]